MKNTFWIGTIFVFLILLGFFLGGNNLGKNAHNIRLQKQNISITNTNHFSTPKTLVIRKIGVKSLVEQVGLDSQGRMDVPKKTEDVAWYKLGAKPGDLGSAVIAGHLDKANGAPSVFWNLKQLSLGDRIEVSDNKNKTLNYIVEKIESFNDSNFPLKEVFANTSEKRLNLITCSGIWDKDNKNYTQRLVVFSNLESD